MNSLEIHSVLEALGDPAIAAHSQRFFKTGPGEYGEGDRFLGIRIPVIRAQVRRYRGLSMAETLRLLVSPYHEVRMFSLLSLVMRFNKGDEPERRTIYEAYLDHTAFINNWDLVDCSAHPILGGYLDGRDRKPLYVLAESESMWERRMAIMACLHFIRRHDYADALRLSGRLLNDGEDLIHKAVGWMLREIGNRDLPVERKFLKTRYRRMPRTMLRYAIERFPAAERGRYLRGEV
ncbi:MAG: DNA alkylation repair protein [Gemmatimonadetes bacterium]|nr:DNA alkylation repair protein [Gemmatimonadota bacterium]MYB62044.1 DNA alkylation repair protein [Gemmatimonadota bacterium]